VDQRNVGTTLTNPASGAFVLDRYQLIRAGTFAINVGQNNTAPFAVLPGTNFVISSKWFRVVLTTAQATLGSGDQLHFQHFVEGPLTREISGDVSSISVLVRSSVANLSFSLSLRDNPTTKSIVKLANIPSANTWTLISLASLPAFPAGNFTWSPGAVGYLFDFCLASGSTLIAPAADTWQSGTFVGAPGMSNFAASPVNSTFDIAFVHHEPGPVCSTLIDKPFSGANGNLDECLRYYCKSYPYTVRAGSVNSLGTVSASMPASQNVWCPVRFMKTMAKAPTVATYSDVTGAVGAVRDVSAGVDRGVATYTNVGDSGFAG
jgi:hypothetical protein